MELNTVIDETLARAEKGVLHVDTFYATLTTALPEVFTFLFDEDTRLLQEPEHDYLLFVAMILLDVIRETGADLDSLSLGLLEEVAEDNWGLIEFTSIENLTETMMDHPAFDLYAFLEDACSPEQDHEILTETAVQLVYVKGKSLIDAAVPGIA